MNYPLACFRLIASIVLIAGSVVPALAEVEPEDSATAEQLGDVYFSSPESELTEHAKRRLDNDAKTINELIQKCPSLKIDLLGYADWIGSDGYNLALSERRANIVKAYLVRQDVPADRISTYAYGESQAAMSADGIDETSELNTGEVVLLSEKALVPQEIGKTEPTFIGGGSLGTISSLSAMAAPRLAR